MAILSNEEIVEQYKRAQEAEQMNYLLILYEQSRGLIAHVAQKYRLYAEIDDLMQEGFFGLKAAADAYDPDQGAFSSYAVIWLKQAMRRYIDNNQTVVRFPVHIREQIFKYRKIREEYVKKYGKSPSDREMMRLLHVSEEQYRKIFKNNALLLIRSTEEVISLDDQEYTLGDVLADPRAEECFERIIEIEDYKQLRDLLWDVDYLTDQEKIVIKERFQDQKILEEIGSEINMTREGVRKIEARALRKYRKDLKIQQYRDDFISGRAYKGTGISSFRSNGTSSTEKAALDLYEREMEAYRDKIEREVTVLSKKYGIDLEEYKKMKIALFKDDLFERYEAKYQ